MTNTRQVQFNDFYTADDWGLIMNKKEYSDPVPKTNYVSVPGRDGSIDLTEALSDVVNYENRQANFIFLLTNGTYQDRLDLLTEIIGNLHGQTVQIVDDDYLNYYMTGRLTVTGHTNNLAYGTITMSVNCDPWRYSTFTTTVNETVKTADGTLQVVISNRGYKTLIPSIVVTGTVNLTYGTTTTALSAGTYTLPDFKLSPGVNTVSISGNGTIAFTYREAIL